MLKQLKKHHIGVVINKKFKKLAEIITNKKFQKDKTQKTEVLFFKIPFLKFYIEFVLKMGRVKNAKIGLHHTCYDVKNKLEIDEILNSFINNKINENNVFEITKIEKSSSKECNYVQFFYFKKLGIIEFNIKDHKC
ncbi:hypothetical protein OAM44_02520 [Pelagibacteraceae bacterium]|nr:hypothetical protein [Pelagibacteraceae bacterium]